MPDDRVKVAGVWMSREEAGRVRAELRRLGAIPSWARVCFPISLILIAVFAGLGIKSNIRGTIGPRPSDGYLQVGFILSGVFWSAMTVWGISWGRRNPERKKLSQAMRNLGWRICTKCDYDLGRDGPAVCPECGTPFDHRELLDHQSRERE